MSKLNEGATTPRASDGGSGGVAEAKEPGPSPPAETETKAAKTEDDKKEILRFTMLFNKYNSDLNMKRRADEDDKKEAKYTMFFNKEVTMSSIVEPSVSANKSLERIKPRSADSRGSRSMSRFSPSRPSAQEFGKPQISDPGMMFESSLTSASKIFDKKTHRSREKENVKRLLTKRIPKAEEDSLVQLNVHPAARSDLRIYNSLTSLSKSKSGLRGSLRSKIPSLTAIETNSGTQTGLAKSGVWDDGVQTDLEQRLNLQISWSSNDNTRRSALKFKKEEAASVSDSKLLYADSDTKKQLKKCDKKSRGDSSKKERDSGGRKQVQWKTEVDVIYFSTHLAANGDRTGEVIGRVMEPLREEWEQQRKGFYAKMVPCHLETHLKYRFISLLQM